MLRAGKNPTSSKYTKKPTGIASTSSTTAVNMQYCLHNPTTKKTCVSTSKGKSPASKTF